MECRLGDKQGNKAPIIKSCIFHAEEFGHYLEVQWGPASDDKPGIQRLCTDAVWPMRGFQNQDILHKEGSLISLRSWADFPISQKSTALLRWGMLSSSS